MNGCGSTGDGGDNLIMDCLNDIYGRLRQNEKDNKVLKEDNILIKERLGIREAANGERKEQLRYAQARINEVGLRAEEGDKDLFTKIDELQKYMMNLVVKLFLVLGFGVLIITVVILLASKLM